jgi:tetratricopeptide (TPR) repeat protein
MIVVHEGANQHRNFNGSALRTEALVDRTVHAKKAQALFSQALREEPKSAELHINLASALKMTGDHGEAVLCYQQAAAISGSVASIYSLMGMAQQATGDMSGAVTSFTRSVELDPGDSVMQMNLGSALVNDGNIHQGVLAFQQSISLQSDNYLAYCNLGVALNLADDVQGAIEALQTSIAIDPSIAAPHMHLGSVQLKCMLPEFGNHIEYAESAITSLNRAIDLDPTGVFSSQSRRELACIKAMQKEAERRQSRGPQQLVDEAGGLLARAVHMTAQMDASKNEKKVIEVCTRATALCDQAEALLLRALQGDPDHVDAQKTLEGVKRVKESMAGFGNTVAAAKLYNEAVQMGASGKKWEAVVAYRKAIEICPEIKIHLSKYGFKPAVHLNLGMALITMDDHHGAIAALSEAIEIDPEWADLRLNLGLALEATGDYPGARASYEAAIALSKPDEGGYSQTMHNDGRVGNSKEFIRTHLVAHFNLANVLQRIIIQDFETTGSFNGTDFECATASYQRVIELDPKDAEAQSRLEQLRYLARELQNLKNGADSLNPPVPSVAEIDSMGIKPLRELIHSAGMRHSDCWEKPELRARAHEAAAVLQARCE